MIPFLLTFIFRLLVDGVVFSGISSSGVNTDAKKSARTFGIVSVSAVSSELIWFDLPLCLFMYLKSGFVFPLLSSSVRCVSMNCFLALEIVSSI